jgi:hypothetical protein
MNNESLLLRLSDHWREEFMKRVKDGRSDFLYRHEILNIFLESQARAMTRLTDEVIKESREMRKEMET